MAKKIFEFILFSNIFIACCAIGLCIETNIILNLPLNTISFYCFVFGATLAQYNFHQAIKKNDNGDSQRTRWASERKYLYKILSGIGVLLILISFLNFHLHHFIILFFIGVIAFLYSFPIIIFGKKKRIKDFGFLKIITLAFTWTLVTVWFPVVNFIFEKNIFLFVFLQRFVFVFIICLLFDLRDIKIDRSENINTIAVMLGKKKSYFLAVISLIVFMIISACQYFYVHENKVLIAMLISAIATFVAILITGKISSELFYLSAIDGMLFLQAALVYVIV